MKISDRGASNEYSHYYGEALRAVAMPLGGIGTGTIALCGDGSLRQWQIQNQINHSACLPHSFFSVWCQPKDRSAAPVTRVLQCSSLYGTKPPQVPWTSNDHLVPACHIELLSQLPGVTETGFIGEYPVARVEYRDSALPVHVHLEAFNPFQPLNAMESGLPTVLFLFRVANVLDRPLKVTLAATLQNAVGWDGVCEINGTGSISYGGNLNAFRLMGSSAVISMTNLSLSSDDPRYGTMALAALRASHPTHLTNWDQLDSLWSDFSDGTLQSESVDGMPSPTGNTWNGALAQSLELGPHEEREITFGIFWHFPNRMVNYPQARIFGLKDDSIPYRLGNQYNHQFHSALDVVKYVDSHLDHLIEMTLQSRKTLQDTNLPRSLLAAVTTQLSTIRSPSCLWTEDERFFGFEGGCGASTPQIAPVGGSCPMNCTHVWNYEMALARLFPDLERTMRETEWLIQQAPAGYLPHRVLLPLSLPRPWDKDSIGPTHPALDGLLGGILKTYREYLACGDKAWLERLWPHSKRALLNVWSQHDPTHAGVIENEQPNTYDISIYGANPFIGGLYLAALRAMAAMATLFDDAELASECTTVFERGREFVDTHLWNGEYYFQDVDFDKYPDHNWGLGCHSDQLLGQWWATQLGLGSIFEPSHVRKALQSIFKYNFRESLSRFEPPTRPFAAENDSGLLNCTWPRGGRPGIPTRYSDEIWTGVEYEVAGLLIAEGEADLAIRLLVAVQERYNGQIFNPWNNLECGDHYVRGMSAWALLERASGFQFDAGRSEITFAPNLNPTNHRAPFVTNDGWGTFAQQVVDARQACSLQLAHGTLGLRKLRLRPLGRIQEISVRMNGRPVNFSSPTEDELGSIWFSELVLIRAREELTILLTLDH